MIGRIQVWAFLGGILSWTGVSQASVVFDLPITYNASVTRWMEYFQKNPEGRSWFIKSLSQSGRYLHLIQQQLRAQGLPTDLVYLAMIESGFNPRAISPKRAVGLWQFIEPTARRYGLHIDSWVDERMDPVRSTKAAIAYLKDLYRQFGNWHLAMAAYNMGENGLERFIQKYRTRDFWRLSRMPDFPRETAEYVPKILACNLLSKAPSLYGVSITGIEPPLIVEPWLLPNEIHLKKLAQALNLFEHTLKDLNPHLKLGIKPAQAAIPIYLPRGTPLKLALSNEANDLISQ